MTDDSGTSDPEVTRTGEHRIIPSGTVLDDRYEIIELAGVGGMGMVYRARDQRLDLDVALKVLTPERAADEATLQRFERELVLARQVSHANVVRIHDIGRHDDLHFLTMDYVAGRSLKSILEQDGALDIDSAVAIGIDLAGALHAAHEKGIVHRDLKPANVLMDEQGRAHITDFGVARSLATAGPTKTGHVLGTPHYLSPEQALGESVDGRSDIYALGLVLFEMISGDLPFTSDSMDESLAQKVAGRPRSFEVLGVDAPTWLKGVIFRCLERDPNRRYPDARALRDDLKRQRSTSPALFSRLPVGRIAAVAAILGAVAAGWWLVPRDAGEVAPDPESAVADEAATSGAAFTLAVVPFRDETGQATLAWVPTGVAEMLAVGLAEAPALQVVESLRTFRTVEDLGLRGDDLTDSETRQLGNLLDADLIIMGRVRAVGDGLQLEAQLAGNAAQESDRRRFSVAAASAGEILQSAEQLTREIRAGLEAGAPESAEPVLSASSEALSAYGSGLDRLTRGDALAAIEPLERAVDTDPAFAAAWVRLADAYESAGYGDKARAAASRAVENLNRPNGRIGIEARAKSAALKGDIEQAVALRRDLVERFPNDIEARVDLGEILGDSGQLDEARSVLEAVATGNPNHPRAWYLLGKFSILAGESQRAIDDYLVRALVIQNRLDNAQGQADVQNAMGIAYSQVGNLKEAQDHYEQAVAMRRELGDRRGVAATLSNLAKIQGFRGDYAGAESRLTEALKIQSEMGDRAGVAYLHNEFGVLEEEQGQYGEALKHYRDALRIREDLGNSRALAESFNNVGYTYFLLGEYDNTAVYIRQALDLYRNDNNAEGVMLARETLALLEMARGNWEESLEAALAALEASREMEMPGTAAVSLGVIGRVAYYQGRFAAGLESLNEALAAVKELGDPRGIAEFTLAIAAVEIALGDVEAARSRLNEAGDLLQEGGNKEQRADLARLRGEADILDGHTGEALALFQAALEDARASGSVTALLEARVGLGRGRLAAGETGPALEILDKAATEADDIGHARLTLESREHLGRAQLAGGDVDAAEATLRSALAVARSVAPYGRLWRIHYHLARTLEAGDGDGAPEQWRAARTALDESRNQLPERFENSFGTLPAVRAVDGRTTGAGNGE